MPRLFAFARARAWIFGLALILACLLRLASRSPPVRSLEGLAGMLGASMGGTVGPTDLVWEAGHGFFWEALFGRRVLFLARTKPDAPHDLYRARVRLALDGSPIGVSQVRNLTETPRGDEVALEASGNRAVFATVAFGRVQAISLLEPSGIQPDHRPPGFLDRFLLALSSFQTTGGFAGIGRTDIVLDVPARAARLLLDTHRLTVDFGERGRSLSYDIDREALSGSDGGEPYAARALPQRHEPKPLLFWLVDSVRAEVGPAPIAWLERVAFGARDSFRRTTYSILSAGAPERLRQDARKATARVLDASSLTGESDGWPPAKIPSLWQDPKPGEGEWEPVNDGFLKPMRGVPQGASPPPYFYRTVIRPDPNRPYSEVLLVAMDTRQLELGMQAGYEDPKPSTGPPGEGHLPKEKAIYERVVATFNGAFKATHGEYGMMVHGRVLLPPVPGGASVIVNQAREIGLGSWPQTEAIPADVISFRQNLDPLVEDGVPNPTGRNIWGWQLEGTSVMTQRTALCVTRAGHLYYAFAEETDGRTLGNALRQAGCSYGIHLDMNPGHCGFILADIRDLRSGDMTVKLLDDRMKVPPDRFARWSAKDFFYVMVRDAMPRDGSSIRWVPDGGVQPPPTWVPGIVSGHLAMGSLEVELLSLEKGRVDYRVRAGRLEFGGDRKAEAGRGFEESESGRVLAAIGLGRTTDATRYGLTYGTTELSPLKDHYATLVLQDGEVPRVLRPGVIPSEMRDREQRVQLPLIAVDGRVVDGARERGGLRMRSGLCVTDTARVLLARVEHDSSDVLGAALLRLGCRDVVELDRGSHHPAFLHRTGSSTPPMNDYEASALYVLGRPMIPHAFRWKAAGSGPSKKVTSYDLPAPDQP